MGGHDIHRVAPKSAPEPAVLSNEVLKPLLAIRDLSAADRAEVERLIRMADEAGRQFPDPPAAVLDLYIERAQNALRRAQTIVERYA